MKVNIDVTVQVFDEQRHQMARVIHGDPKRTKDKWATRDELKQFIWHHGEGWAQALADKYADLTGEGVGPNVAEQELDFGDDMDDEDLI